MRAPPVVVAALLCALPAAALPVVGPPVAAPSVATPTPPGDGDTSTAAQLDARFAPRAYVVAGREVPVFAKKDMLALRTALPAHAVASLVEEALAHLAPDARIAHVKRLLSAPSRPLVSVELVEPLPRDVLVALAASLDAHASVRAYPVLSRMTGRAFADDHLVVTAAPGRLGEVLPRVLAAVDGRVVRTSTVPDTALVAVGARMAFDAVTASAHVAAHASSIPGLVSAEPDLVRELAAKAVVLDDPRFAEQWHIGRSAQSDVPGVGETFADDAWDVTLGDPEVRVAVFDTGIDVDHPDLAEKIVGGFDASGDDDDPRPECTQGFDGRDVTSSCPDFAPYRESHGTSVAGIIGAQGDNGIDVAGVCPLCSIVPVRLLGDDAATGIGIAEAFIRAVRVDDADVINNSWGPGFSLFFPLSTGERAAFRIARDEGRDGKGTVIVFAAGNDTADVASDAYAAHPDVIAVAATTNVDDWAYYSNYGFQIDVAAPSQGAVDPRDGFDDDDFGLVTTDVEGNDGYDGDDVNTGFGGTSGASPVVAGVVGLILSANPELTAQQVRLVLTSTADKIRADKVPWENLFGQDIEAVFEYDEVGHSIGFGYGRVHAARAVEAALTPPLTGASCDDDACTFCSADDRCLERCDAQSDCPDGSVCGALGACELPREVPSRFLSPCSSDCAYCTPTLDTEFLPTSICTVECGGDEDCPDGFDCRLTEEGGPSICGVGDKGAGNPADFFGCFSPQIGTSVVVVSGAGRALCGDICFGDGPGACPFGFTCATADCECTASGQFGCFEFTCGKDDFSGVDESDFFFPVCLPDEGHADICDSDVDCQFGDYCNAQGRCALDDRAGCDICNTCATDADCLGRGVCIGARDDGIGECAWACGDADPCPGDSVCREVEANFGTLFVCLSPEGGAAPEDRCDPGYTCSVACRDDVPCGSGEECVEGACVPATPPDGDDDDDDAPAGCSSTGATLGTAGSLFALLLALRRRARNAR